MCSGRQFTRECHGRTVVGDGEHGDHDGHEDAAPRRARVGRRVGRGGPGLITGPGSINTDGAESFLFITACS